MGQIIRLDDPEEALRAEWLCADGAGGFAMGTALGACTRRYHGLLIAAARPPVGRVLTLHSIVEQAEVAGSTGPRIIDLSSQCFGDDASLHPAGWRHLRSFEIDGETAAWSLDAGAVIYRRTVRVEDGRVQVRYRFDAPPGDLLFRARLLMPLRDFHELDDDGRADSPAHAVSDARDDGFVVRRGDLTARVATQGGTVRIEPEWWADLAYREDRDRGQSWREDVHAPGVIETPLRAGAPAELVIEVGLERRGAVASMPSRAPSGRSGPLGRLLDAARAFRVVRVAAPERAGDETHASIIAGYPWFADWGRDAMISLPGLLLVPGHLDEAASVLRLFASHLRGGLMPNCFDDRGSGAAYNGADTSLWFIDAVLGLIEARGADGVEDLVLACRSIVAAYRAGTGFGVRIDDAGLVVAEPAAEEGPVTWMDARRGGATFTPRRGRPVELSALWLRALHGLAELATGPEAAALRVEAERTAVSMREAFWWPERACLHDVVSHDERGRWRGDGRLRPNQLFAVCLEPSAFDPAQQRAVVETVTAHLLTPFGLRTLDPAHADYRGRYEGDLMARDAAYHNGTVWPWLIEPWARAVLRVGGRDAREQVRSAIVPLLGELDRGCLGQIAEVYDGDVPQRASGCPAQAWSVAALVRVLALIG